jgi:CHAT domain-containing protein
VSHDDQPAVSHDDQRRLRADAEGLLRRPSWNDDEIDHAVALHDLLLTPDPGPDPTAELRKRLVRALRRRPGRPTDLLDRTRAEHFSSGWLDSPNALERRLCVLQYQGFTSFLGFQTGALGLLDRAVNVLLELDRAVLEGGTAARALMGSRYESALINLAAACYIRYDGRRELLLLDQTTAAEREMIKADLDRAADAAERVIQSAGPSLASAVAILGSCYVRRYEDDERYKKPETIDSAIALLQDAVSRSGAGRNPGEIAERVGIKDRLAAALMIRNRKRDIDAAIELLTEVKSEAALLPFYNAAGGALTMATARLLRWTHTGSPADRESARAAYLDGFASALGGHLPTAVDIATQWGGWAWSEGWWAEAGEAYSRAMRALHLAVRRQASRDERELILRKAPGVAAMAALGLARGGAKEAALVALETGRAVLLAETFDRRSLDYDRIATLAGPDQADRYRFLTTEMTRLETLLLADRSGGGGRLAADLEALRNERFALTRSLGSDAVSALADLDHPPTFAELCQAAGDTADTADTADTPVVHLATTGQGGIALILREGAVELVDLPELTTDDAAGMVAALDEALVNLDLDLCDQVCEALWDLAMAPVLRALDGVAHAIVIPGGRLSALPWHAARIPGQRAEYVLDRLAISYMPNIRSVPRARAAGRDMTRPLRVLAIPQPMPTAMGPLPATGAEIATVCSHGSERFQVTRLPGTEATVQTVRDAFSRFEVIHFAGHAEAVPDDPLASAMSMAHDQPLTVRDMLTRDTGTMRFAVLSACETARAEDPLSDEIVNFPTALLQCGLSGVVGSLWTSNDRASSMMMETFYAEWQGNRAPPAEALRTAQQQTRDHRFASPLFWANFVYVGL